MSMKILFQGLLLIVVVTGLTLSVTAALAIATRTTLALYIAFVLPVAEMGFLDGRQVRVP